MHLPKLLFPLFLCLVTTAGENPASVNWNDLKLPSNGMALFPERAVAAVFVPNLASYFNLKDSGLVGDMLNAEFMKPLHVAMDANDNPQEALFNKILTNDVGYFCAGFTRKGPQEPPSEAYAMLFEVTDPEKKPQFDQMIRAARGAPQFTAQKGPHNLEIHVSRKHAFAWAGRCLLVGKTAEEIEELAGKLLKPDGLSASTRYTTAAQPLPDKFVVELALDVPAALNALQTSLSQELRTVGIALSGYQIHDYLVLRQYSVGRESEEKWCLTYSAEFMEEEADRKLRLDARAELLKKNAPHASTRVPQDAVAAAFMELDGAELAEVWQEILPFFDWIYSNSYDNAKGPPDKKRLPSEVFEKFEAETKMGFEQLFLPLQDVHAVWVSQHPEPIASDVVRLRVPDLGLDFSCKGEDQARTFSSNLERVLKYWKSSDSAVETVQHGAFTLRIFDFLPPDNRLKRPVYPTQLVWSVWKESVIVGTSLDQVKSCINSREKHEPMLADRKDYSEYLKGLTPGERLDHAFYLDLRTSLAQAFDGARRFLPPQGINAQEDAKVKAYRDLPPGREVFKALTSIKISVDRSKSEYDITTLRSPIGLCHILPPLFQMLAK